MVSSCGTVRRYDRPRTESGLNRRKIEPTNGSAGLATTPGLPATVVPIGLSEEGFPIGAQFLGPMYENLTTIHFAQLIEREFRGIRAASSPLSLLTAGSISQQPGTPTTAGRQTSNHEKLKILTSLRKIVDSSYDIRGRG